MSQTNWEADKMLDVYIYDYLMKRKLHNSAKAFQAEGKVSTEPVAIDAPGGFLFEWWSVFWDIFIARTNGKHSEAAASYIETQMIKAREQQHQQQQQQQQHQQQQASSQQQQQKSPQHQQQQHTQMQMQNLQIRQAQHQQQQQQQHRRDMGSQILSGPADVLVGNDSLLRQSPSTVNSLAAKMYEDKLKIPIPMQKDSFDDGAMKQRFGENVGQIIDPSIVKAAALASQASGQMLLGMPEAISGNLQQAQNRHQLQQLPNVPGTPQDIKNILMNSKGVGPDGSLTGIHGLNQGGSSNNLTLKGWPLTALEKLRPGYNIPQGNSMLQSPQAFNQMQQNLWLQSQHNLTSPSANDLESRKMRMMIANSRSMNSVGDMANIGSPVQSSYPVLPRADPDILLKMQQQQQQQMQNNNQQQLQYSQHQLLNQTPQNSSHQMRQQEKILGASSVAADGSVSANSFQGNEQASKSQGGRKRKQPVSSSGPANSSGTANTTGPSPSSPSTPSTHTPADAISMPTMAHNGASSKSLLMYGSDGLGQITSASNQLADIDRFVDDGSLEDNVESFLSQEDADPRDRVTRCSDVSKGFTFSEVAAIPASTNKIECCHFSSDGKFLATGGHDRKAVLWCTESYSVKSTHEEHSQWITDVRFSPTLSRFATSSADKTVRVWDADNPGYSLRNFTGHSTTVMSLDFHPNKEDLICSCDNNSEIRYWSVKNGSCVGVSKGGATQLRFQPCFGRILAATADNYVSLLDVETQVCISKLQGHKSIVNSVTWDFSGEYVASVSHDLVRVWRVGSNNKSEQSYELRSTGNKFHTCIFHPSYPILIIGCYEALEIWNMAENKVMSVHAHDKLVSSLAVSKATGLFASASHDKTVKLWH